ncbi:MAG TPA: hypothetical protein VM290_08335 [Gaiellaceae bacterium]|nr:hypothetical protein [Gaiellaceae bacterium]
MHATTVRRLLATPLAAVVALAITGVAAAATIVVTENSSSWHPLDTRPGGSVRFTEDHGAPPGLGSGSLELRTDASTAAKADYFTLAHAGTPLAGVTTLSYWTYQVPTPQPPIAAPSFQLQIDVNGDATGGFTTLVYEPYWNGTVAPATWQQWDVDAGRFWSSRTVADGTCVLAAGAGGPPFYTLEQVQAMCPDAVVLGIGVNVGSFNPGWTVAADGVTFNDTTYDFEVARRPRSKQDCKNGGWATFNDPAYRNQGDCVSDMARP